ncbi:MAG: hypothetical protein GKR96_13935 [Gammaproteobacteria bacterium]|nr:hypothetical protein [Gammaproteobacteria bacterium]
MPDQPEPMNNLGATYQLQNKLGQAVRQFNETIKRFPNFVAAYENLGDTYVRIAANQYAAGSRLNQDYKALLAKSKLSHQFQKIAQKQAESQNTNSPEQTSKKKPHQLQHEIVSFLESWVNAWSSKDTNGYFAHYSQDFTPLDGMSFNTWKQRKTGIFEAAKYIKIQIEEIAISQRSEGTLEITFQQNYQSDRYQHASQKKLTLVSENQSNRFAIVREE